MDRRNNYRDHWFFHCTYGHVCKYCFETYLKQWTCPLMLETSSKHFPLNHSTIWWSCNLCYKCSISWPFNHIIWTQTFKNMWNTITMCLKWTFPFWTSWCPVRRITPLKPICRQPVFLLVVSSRSFTWDGFTPGSICDDSLLAVSGPLIVSFWR